MKTSIKSKLKLSIVKRIELLKVVQVMYNHIIDEMVLNILGCFNMEKKYEFGWRE